MNNEKNLGEDAKAKMQAALDKKKNGNRLNKSAGIKSGSRVGSGQTSGSEPKMHRRKSGSA